MSRWLLAVLLAGAGLVTAAETPVRYHFGDDPRWSDPNFDDSSWRVAKDGRWPVPPFDGSGIMWVRFRVPVPADYSGPLAIGSPGIFATTPPDEIWVNGHRAGGEGKFPPHPHFMVAPVSTVFDLAAGSATPGQTALVALRAWYPPATSVSPQAIGYRFEIGPRELLRLRESDTIARSWLSHSFDVIENLAFLVLGAALLAVWRLSRGSRDLLWFGTYLLAWGCTGAWQLAPSLLRPQVPFPAWQFGNYLLVWCGFVALLEFLWSVFSLGRRWPLRVLEAAIGMVCILLTSLNAATEPAGWIPIASKGWGVVFLALNVVLAAISAWQFRRSPGTRGVAAAMVVWSTTLALTEGGVWIHVLPLSYQLGAVAISTEDTATILFITSVGFLLLRRLWTTWTRTRELDAEFEAARQMQQSLVPPAAGAAGFAVASVYLPSREVGGDFFWTVPAGDGSLLLVAGDVSGKGLKAAMTVATIAGALRNESSRQPALVLARLNTVLLGHGRTGFTTCCAAFFDGLGHVTIANAGHVLPYCNGEEVHVESGLPLGLIAEPDYAEAVVTLRPGEGLTFVSDGVVEARNANREIYGFDRMRALSMQPAARIAETAQAFGQEDDISVITIERSAVAARAA